MKMNWKCGVLLWLGLGLAVAQAAEPERGATVAPFAKAPTIDGKIEPGEWDGAVGTVGFQDVLSQRGMFLDARGGRTMFGFHGDRLYIAMISELPPTGVRARQASRDADLVWDDGLEIWFDPNRDRRESKEGDQSFYQMIGNPLGAIEDKRFDPAKGAPDASWDGDWEFANSVDEERMIWTAELSLPFADIGWEGSPIGRSLGVMIARNFKMPWNQAPWFPHHGAFVSWFEYPRIFLTKDAPSAQVTSLGDRVYDGVLQLRAKIFNPGPARQATVDLFITSSDMPELKDVKTLDLPAGGAVEYAYDVPEGRLHPHGQHELVFKVDSADQPVMRWGRRWTNVADTMMKLNPAGTGRKWDVRTGPDPDAAVQVAHYPSYQFVRVKVDTRELEKEAEAIQKAGVVITDPSGKQLASGELTWEKAPAEQEFAVKLPEGESTVTVTLDGRAEPFVRKVTRKIFPWEGNTLGITEEVSPPFEPIQVNDRDVSVVLRTYRVNGLGLWDSIQAAGNVSAGPAREILAAPMALQANGETLTGQGRFTKQAGHEVVYEGEARHASVTVKTRTTTEYDGCMKVELELLPPSLNTEHGTLNTLSLDIPLHDSIAPLFHVSTTSLRVNPAEATPAGEGVIWNSRQFPDGEWYGNFKPYLWVGGEERGLCWFADNDAGWVLDVDEQLPAKSAPSLELIRRDGVLTLRVNLVQKPVTITEPRQITFGLLASPAKPMRSDWRQVTFSTPYQDYPNIAWMGAEYWGSDEGYSAKYPRHGDLSVLDRFRDARLGEPFDRAAFIEEWAARNCQPDQKYGHYNAEQLRSLVQTTLNMGAAAPGPQHRFSAYWEEFHSTSALHEEVATFGSEWSGRYGYGSTGGIVPSYRDFAVWWGAEFIRRGIGLYFDNACPMRAYDLTTTSAYRLPNGRIQPSAGLWARREYLKRIWVIHRTEADPRMPVIQIVHITNTHILPYLVWNDANLDLEWFYGPEPQQAKYAPDLLRTESLGRQSGNLPLVMANIDSTKTPEEKAFIERTRFGTMMIHEIKARMWHEDGQLLRRVLDFGYGQPDCEVFNYWDENHPVKISNAAQVKSLLLKRGSELLLVLCMWNPNPEPITLAFDFPVSQVADAETGETVAEDAGKFRLNLDGYGVRFLQAKIGQ
jgi:hypothetical protein